VIIARGRVAADDTPAGLLARSRYHEAIALSLAPGIVEQAEGVLRAVAGVAAVERWAEGLIALPRPGAAIAEPVAAALAAAGLRAHETRIERGRMDEVFRTITSLAPSRDGPSLAPAREAA